MLGVLGLACEFCLVSEVFGELVSGVFVALWVYSACCLGWGLVVLIFGCFGFMVCFVVTCFVLIWVFSGFACGFAFLVGLV